MGFKYYQPAKPLSQSQLDTLINTVKQRGGKFTNIEMMCLPIGTQIRLRDSVRCPKVLKAVGALVFQPSRDADPGEKPFGILIKDKAVSFDYSAADYEFVSFDLLEVPQYSVTYRPPN